MQGLLKIRVRCRPHSSWRLRAFTLVELLVSISILVLLTVLVLAAFQRDDSDRLSASARMLQSYFEGARSRAINDGKIRGVRLLRSTSDPAIANTLAYVGSPGFHRGTCTVEWWRTIPSTSIQVGGIWVVKNSQPGLWKRLIPDRIQTTAGPWMLNPQGRGLLPPVARIELPEGSGQWYTMRIGEDLNLNGVLDTEDTNGNGVLDPNEDDGNASAPLDDQDGIIDTEDFVNPNGSIDYEDSQQHVYFVLTSHFVDSRWDNNNNIWVANSTSALPYRIELAPTILPNTEPVQLESGIAIDLDACQLPPAWRPVPANTPYADFYDILFDRRGMPTGTIAATGLIHLYLTTRADIETARGQDPNHPRFGAGAGPYTPWPLVPGRAPIVPKTEPIVLSVFTQGGQVTTSNINPANLDSNAWADDPYSFARRGQEAK